MSSAASPAPLGAASPVRKRRTYKSSPAAKGRAAKKAEKAADGGADAAAAAAEDKLPGIPLTLPSSAFTKKSIIVQFDGADVDVGGELRAPARAARLGR